MSYSGYQKFDSIIVDGDIDTRMRLRQATSSVTQFGKVTALNDLREGLTKIDTLDRCDVIFLSSRFPEKDVKDFVTQAKASKRGQDSAYILVLTTSNQDSTTIQKNVMLGVDGFLFEPYSVDQLVEITTLAAKVKKDRSQARERVALTLMLNNIMAQIDLVSFLRGQKADVGLSMKKLRDLTEPIVGLSPESFAHYTELAIKAFGEAPLPKKMFRGEAYKGASSRVKRKNEQKVVADVEAQIAKSQTEPTK